MFCFFLAVGHGLNDGVLESQHYGACSTDRADVFDLPDLAAVRFEVASVDGRAAAVAARDVESSDSPVSSSSIHELA